MKKGILLIALVLAIGFAGFSQSQSDSLETQKSTWGKNEIGFHAGFTTGLGLSYRHWFSEYGFQITVLPVKSDDNTFVSAGITGLKTFMELKYFRCFIYAGGHYYYNERTDIYENWDYDQNYEVYTITEEHIEDHVFNFGGGLGFSVGYPVSYNLMLGYGAYDITGKFNLLPSCEMGLKFVLK